MGSNTISANKTIWMSILFLLTAAPLAQAGTLGPLTYQVNGDTVTITDCDTSVTNVVVPETIEGKPVTIIGHSAFQSCDSLTDITIPSSVASIESYAFKSCGSLASITIPEGVASIGNNAFHLCNLLVSITLPSTLTSIEDHAFDNCRSLENITLPAGLTSIGNSAFNYCISLASIAIPDGITTIGTRTFYGCSSLASIMIPDGLSSIEDYALYDCSSLTNITIPSSVTSIGGNAFSGCSSLASIAIPEGITSIDRFTLYECTSLTNIILPTTLTSIGDYAFSDCSSLASVTIPEGVTSIGDHIFYQCSFLTNIILPSTLISIGDRAFNQCSSLSSITIPEMVTAVGDLAFYECSNLLSIDVEPNNANYASESGVLFNAAQTQLIQYPEGKPNTTYTIPISVTNIGDSAFINCHALENIDIPEGVTSIENSAFSGCSSLASLTFPTTLTSIGNSAFSSCSSIVSIIIPEGVTSIESYAFSDCNSLTGILVPSSVNSIGHNTFLGCTSLTSIDVDVGNLNYTSVNGVLYDAAQTELILYPKSKVGYYTFPHTVTRMDSSAFVDTPGLTGILIPQWTYSLPNLSGCTNLAAIDIEAGHPQYSSLDGVVFNTNRTELIKYPEAKPGSYTVPDGVVSIRGSSFREHTALSGITFSASVTNIGSYAFAYCTSLTNIVIPTDVSIIGNSAFGGCSSVLSFSVEPGNSNFSSIDGVLFNADQTELIAHPGGRTGHYTIPDGVMVIGYDAFLSNAVSSISIPSGVTTLRQGAFSRCQLLTEITLPGSITMIDRYAFDWCISLTNITIPPSVTDIGYFAFENCTQLRNATFLGDAPYLGSPHSSLTFRTFHNTAPGFTIHYLSSSTGFTSPPWIGSTSPPWSGYPVTSWFMDYGLDPVSVDLDLDGNGDGVTLLEAYALNLDPALDLSDSLPQAMITSNTMSMAYHAASPGITYAVETSTNLVDWTDTGVSVAAIDTNQFSTATVDTTDPCRFLRLRIEQ